MQDTITHNGVVYTKTLRFGSTTKYKYEGGPVGGTIFIDGTNYGWSGEWYDNFAAAADAQQARCRKTYEAAKAKVDAYEAQADMARKVIAPVDVYKVLKQWATNGNLDIEHIGAISREVAAMFHKS